MFSFLREANNEDGTPGPLSMRRLAAALCLISAIGAAVFALVIIFRTLTAASPAVTDWKVFFPMFIPSLAFLAGCILFLFFTTWEDIKGIISTSAEFNKKK